MNDELASAVLAAEQKRCAAMLANDGRALAALLDDRLQFHHANGAADTKDTYLAKMAAGRIRYVGISWSAERVTPLGPDVAMLTGQMVTDVRVDGVDKRLGNRVITVWCRNGGEWRLVAFQSTPMAS